MRDLLASGGGIAALPTQLAPIAAQLIDAGQPPVPWRNVQAILAYLNVRGSEVEVIRGLYAAAMKPRRSNMPQPADGRQESRAGDGRGRRPLRDADGYDTKPNPLADGQRPKTFVQLDEHLRRYHAWWGRPSSRQIAKGSDGAFCHATVNNLLLRKDHRGRKPFSSTQKYVYGFVLGCGGDEADARRYITVWRVIAGLNDHG